jgi:hypothetical protein
MTGFWVWQSTRARALVAACGGLKGGVRVLQFATRGPFLSQSVVKEVPSFLPSVLPRTTSEVPA